MTHYAIVAFPHTDSLEAIESVRQRIDPQAGMIAAHVTLVFPFQSPLPSGAIRSHVAGVAERTAAFRVRLAGVRISDGEYLYLDIDEGRQHVIALHQQLYTGPLADFHSSERPYEPHVTIGRSADARALEDARLYASPLVPASYAAIDELAIFRLDAPDVGSVDSSVPLALTTRSVTAPRHRLSAP